jgi:hypothetical protein
MQYLVAYNVFRAGARPGHPKIYKAYANLLMAGRFQGASVHGPHTWDLQ